jgi:hypothetical protein
MEWVEPDSGRGPSETPFEQREGLRRALSVLERGMFADNSQGLGEIVEGSEARGGGREAVGNYHYGLSVCGWVELRKCGETGGRRGTGWPGTVGLMGGMGLTVCVGGVAGEGAGCRV